MGSNEHNYVHWGTISVASFLTDRWALSLSLRIANFTGGRGSAWAGAEIWGRGQGRGLRKGRQARALSGQQQSSSHFGLNSPVLTFIRGFPSPAPPPLALPPGRMLWDSTSATLECRLLLRSLLEPLLCVTLENRSVGLRPNGCEQRLNPGMGLLPGNTTGCCLCHICWQKTPLPQEKDPAPPRIRAASSAHLFWLYSEFK